MCRMKSSHPQSIRKIVAAFPGLTPELQKAAKYMIEHPEDVALNSMRRVADAAGVQPATISRLSKSLGYPNYDELRKPFRDQLRDSHSPGYASRMRDVQKRGSVDLHSLFRDFREQEIDNIERTLSDEQYAVLLDAVETLWSSRRVYVLGLRGAYAPAFLFHYVFQLFRDRSQLLDTAAGIFADQLRNISKKDSLLVISFQPYTQLTIDAINYAAESGVRIIAITDSIISPAALPAKHTIVTRTTSESFYHSFTGALAVCQALITLLVARSGGDSVKILKQAEQQLSRISAYW